MSEDGRIGCFVHGCYWDQPAREIEGLRFIRGVRAELMEKERKKQERRRNSKVKTRGWA